MTINKGILVAIAIVFGFNLLLGIIWGCKRGFWRALLRTVTIALAAVGALFITSALLNAFGASISSTVRLALEKLGASFAELTNASPSLIDYIINIASALVAPIIFLFISLLLFLLTLPIYAILGLFIPRKYTIEVDARGRRSRGDRVPPRPLSRLFGVILSCAGALIVSISVLAPISGYLSVAAKAYPEVQESGLLKDVAVPAFVETELSEVSNNQGIKVVNLLGGKFLFNKLTVVNRDSKSTSSAEDELSFFSELLPAVTELEKLDLSSGFDKDSTLDLSAIDQKLLPVIEKSPYFKQILAEIISYASTNWKNGETFLGVDLKAQVPANCASALDVILSRLSATKATTVVDDLSDFVNTIELLSQTYNYMVDVTDTINVSPDKLKDGLTEMLSNLTPGSAELLAAVLSEDIVSASNLPAKSTSTVSSLLSDALSKIAALDETDRVAESAALNAIISYASTSRKEEIAPDDIVSLVMSSSAIKEVLLAQPSSAEEQEIIVVSATQKAAIDAAVTARLETAADNEKLALEAISNLFSDQASS